MTDPKYSAGLELLDTKAGRVHTLEDCQRIGHKLGCAPETITDDEIVILGAFHGEAAAARARALRTKALVEPPPAPKESATAQPAAPSEYVTRQQLKAHDDMRDDVLVLVLKKIMAQRDERIAALESRVLELEAQLAAREAVPHVVDR